MKKIIILILCLASSLAIAAAPAPYPITVNSRAATAPPLNVYRGNETTIRASFVDGSTASTIATNETPFLSWWTNDTSSSIVSASYEVVSGTTGVVDFTFSQTDLNYAGGRYGYEIGVKNTLGAPSVYRQGVFEITGSPTGSGATPVDWTTSINWALYDYSGTSASGPIRADGTSITTTINADGSVTFAATTGGSGDMLKATYDPTTINGDAFAMSNMVESTTELILTDTERSKLSGIDAGAETNNISDVDATDLTDSGDSTLHYHATDRDRANHTGTQDRDTITGFDAAVETNATVASALQSGDNVSELTNDSGYGVGDVTKVSTPLTNQIGVWTGDGAIEGQSDFVRLASGNVGIGTNAPAGKLDIVYDGNDFFSVKKGYVDLQRNGTQIRIDADGVGDRATISVSATGSGLAFGGSAEDAQDVVIDANGYVGINTNAPATALEVHGTVTATAGSFVENSTNVLAAAVAAQATADAAEPVLGNPATTGYVLSSTDAGTRSWVVQSGGGSSGLTSNTTVTITNGTPSADIQAQIDAQPKNQNGYDLIFQFADGTFTTSNSLTWSYFYGGILKIYGNTGDASSTNTAQSVFIDGSGHTSSVLGFDNIVSRLLIFRLKVEVSDTANKRCIDIANCSGGIYASYNYLLGSAKTTGNSGFYASLTSASYVKDNLFSNVDTGIRGAVSRIFSRNNNSTHTIPNNGLWAEQGATIGKQDAVQPDGTVGPEKTDTGGIIR